MQRLPITIGLLVFTLFVAGVRLADAQQAPAPAEEQSESGSMFDSELFQVSWPKIEMPKFQWKLPGMGDPKETGQPRGQNPVSETFDKVSDASKRAAGSVRKAWGDAMEKLPFQGDSQQAAPQRRQVAQRKEPGFWSRMFGSEEEPKGSQTVSEFIAQDRVGTTRR